MFPPNMSLGLFSIKSGSVFNCYGGSLLSYHIHFYLTFAYFKLAVIGQQIYYRFKKGQTQDQRFANLNRLVESLIHYALNYSRGI